MKTYDAWFIFPTALKEEGLAKSLKDVENEVTKLQGKITDTQRMGVRTFARPMKKQSAGQYVRMSLSMEPASMRALQGRLKLNENIFRVQIVQAEVIKGVPAPVNVDEKEDRKAKEEVVSDGKS